MPSKIQRARSLVQARGVVRAADFTARRIPRIYLSRLVQAGELIRRGSGVYSSAAAGITVHHSLVEVARVAPRGTICLLSALAYHDLGTQLPHDVWLAIGRKARRPAHSPVRLRVIRMSGRRLTSGVEIHRIEGVPVRIFSAPRTLADCFAFRNKIGLDVAVEALRAYRRRRGDLSALWKYAKLCRVERIIRPYLEALT